MPDPKPSLLKPSPRGPFHFQSLVRSGWIYPLATLAVLLFLLSSRLIGSYDLGTHLRSGQWIVQNHAFPSKDLFTYTQNDRDYQDPYGLYQILLYGLYQIFGYTGLSWTNTLAIFGVFGLLLWRLKLSHASPGTACILLLAAALTMERRFTVRPEVFSWFFLSTTLLVLDLRNRGRDFLFLLPVLQLLWVNFEGLFVLGWFAMAAYIISGGLQQKNWDSKLVRYSLMAFFADLLNPYFLKGWLFPFVLWTRLQGSNLHKQTIVELYSPWEYLKVQGAHYDLNLHVLLFFILAPLVILLVGVTFSRRKFHEIFLLAAFGYMAATAVRNIPLFTLIAIPLLSSSWSDLAFRRNWAGWAGKKVAWVLTLFVALIAARVATNAFYVGDRRVERVGWGLDTEQLPVRAAEFLTQHHLDGRLLNDLNTGGWLDWRAPQPTFIDGRSEVMGDEFYRLYHESFRELGLMELIVHYQPQLILAQYNAVYPWVGQLSRLSGWRLIYLDENAAVWAAPDYAKEWPPLVPSSLLLERGLPPATDESVARQLEQTQPSILKAWIEGFFRPQNYSMGLQSLGLFSLRTGEYSAARDFFLEALRRAGGGYPEIFYNLGVANLRLGNIPLGRQCLENVLQLKPSDSSSLQMLKTLGSL